MKILIIGANAAGMSFAAKYLRNDSSAEIIAIEKRDYVSFGSCGLPYYAGGFFEEKEEMFARSVEQTIKSGIDLRINSEVISVDTSLKEVTIKADNKEYIEKYDKLIVSSGARPIVPNFGEFNKDRFTTLTTLEDGEKLKSLLTDSKAQKVCVIGGGFIGLECVESIKHRGLKPILIEGEKRVLSKTVGEEISDLVLQELKDNDVDTYLDTKVIEIKDKNQGYEIHTSNGIVEVDTIICAVGFSPNTGFIDVEKINNGAILVDEHCKTSIEDVYALGDCATIYNAVTKKSVYVPLATNANKLGRMLADYLAGKEVYYEGTLSSSCLKVMNLEIASTGAKVQDFDNSQIEVAKKVIVDMNHTSYYPGQSKIVVKIIFDKETHQIYGCEMAGQSGVVHRMDAIAVAITNKLTTEQLGYIDFCYAPPFARTWDILNVVGNVVK